MQIDTSLTVSSSKLFSRFVLMTVSDQAIFRFINHLTEYILKSAMNQTNLKLDSQFSSSNSDFYKQKQRNWTKVIVMKKIRLTDKEYKQLSIIIKQTIRVADFLRKNLSIQEIQLQLQMILQNIKTDCIDFDISRHWFEQAILSMTRQVNFNVKRLNARKASTIHSLILASWEILINIEINISEVTYSNFFERNTLFATKSQSTSNSFCSISDIMKENKNINIIEVMNLNFDKWKMTLKKNIVYNDLHDVIVYNSDKNSIEIIIERSWREALVEMHAWDQSHFCFNIKKSDSDETTKIVIQIRDFINIYSCRSHHCLINKFSRHNLVICRLE